MGIEFLKPYISVTGFTTPEQVRAVYVPVIPGYDIFLSVLCNPLTMETECRTSRLPDMKHFARTLEAIEGKQGVEPVVHLCIGDRFKDVPGIEATITKILRHPVHALQINTSSVAVLRDSVHFLEQQSLSPLVIFQLNRGLMKKFHEKPDRILSLFNTTAPRNGSAYALLDLSGGHGTLLNYECAVALRDMIHGYFPKLHFAVAGGVTLDTVGTVISRLGLNVGVDIESRVRDSNDCLDVQRVNRYLASAAATIEKATLR